MKLESLVINAQFFGTDALSLSKTSKFKKIIYILADEASLEATMQNCQFILPNRAIFIFPAWDVLPYDFSSPKLEIMASRIQALHKIKTQEEYLCITSIKAITQYSSPSSGFNILTLAAGATLDREKFLDSLYSFGYTRSSVATNLGDMAVRGGIIDLIPQVDYGIRIDTLGNTIESIKIFDCDTQRTLQHINSFEILPLTEIIYTKERVAKFIENYIDKFESTDDVILHNAKEGIKTQGVEQFLPLFYDKLGSIFNYAPKDSMICFQEKIWESFEERWEVINNQHQQRIQYSRLQTYNILEPEALYLHKDELLEHIAHFSSCIFTNFQQDGVSTQYKPIPSIISLAALHQVPIFDLLRDYGKSHKIKLIICCMSDGSRERMSSILKQNNIKHSNLKTFSEIDTQYDTLALALFNIENAFSTDQYIMFSEKDILGERLHKTSKKRNSDKKFFIELESLRPKDFVVHIEHGIGQFLSLETIDLNNKTRDFIKILYAKEDVLYVPVENLDLITKYSDHTDDIPLDRLSTAAWHNRKARIKNRIKLAATELLKIAAVRKMQKGVVLTPTEHYKKFCEQFPYVETEDQISATDDILHDLSSMRPMDRLICGDVGFGKTEVAMRAVCVATLGSNPVQVAIIVPTTLLARQHYESFQKRFSSFPVRIAQLSKFTTQTQAKKIKEAMSKGEVDIVIGTHALLADGIKFANLGLIVIDEEQHFGVAQKEKLKKMKEDVHILTLSATPIPRTLHMSLNQAKDLSIIATPPIERLPIETRIMQFDPVTIREAILREKLRGGRIFYITPKIADLADLEKTLKSIVPEVKIAVAHGQMSASILDDIMNDFYDGRYDLLLSTTIIESGLDIAIANTIIINKAENFGLSQLYQIRGRVGRGNIQAHAYMIIGKKVHSLAQQKLSILESCNTLNSGFTIASHDMDIRGFGNMLGDEQSGHIREIGIELYQDMLEQAMTELQNTQNNHSDKNWSPVLNIGFSVQIPESYISDTEVRISVYRKISSINTEIELEQYAAELIDRFGSPLPSSVNQLISTIKLKQLAKATGICRIERGPKGFYLQFKDGYIQNPEKILQLVQQFSSSLKMKPDNKLVYTGEFDDATFIKTAEDMLRKL